MIGRIFVGIWRGLDGLRKFLHLVVLLMIFGFVVGALRTSIPHIADSSALVIAPQGRDRRAALRQPGRPGARTRAGRCGRTKPCSGTSSTRSRPRRRTRASRRWSSISTTCRAAASRRSRSSPPPSRISAARARRSSRTPLRCCRSSTTSPRTADEIYLDPLGLVASTATSATARITRICSTSSASR